VRLRPWRLRSRLARGGVPGPASPVPRRPAAGAAGALLRRESSPPRSRSPAAGRAFTKAGRGTGAPPCPTAAARAAL